ncbi:hypothetical protein QN277_005613 [Acacia crassicarpa]|uniref:Protein kinase domain-containing protein n=1 Tax=Acacia crassicarpa TaxID=499986 RepID=A0AAE1JXD7_9FABA|nr:hypothetical protein QN277_005613 [Acacia crassicarpa]
MSCFSYCEDDAHLKAAESGRPYVVKHSTGNDGNYHASEAAKQSAQTVRVQPIEVPTISASELNEIADNFGTNSLIGEGSYGRIYYGVLKNSVAATIKKLKASKQPTDEFLAQFSMVSGLKHENSVQLLGYCVDGSFHVLAYEFASNGSLHDILHGRKGVKGAQPSPALSWTQSVKVTIGATKGLEYSHVAKIADFDLSNQAPDMAARFHFSAREVHITCLINCSISHSVFTFTWTSREALLTNYQNRIDLKSRLWDFFDNSSIRIWISNNYWATDLLWDDYEMMTRKLSTRPKGMQQDSFAVSWILIWGKLWNSKNQGLNFNFIYDPGGVISIFFPKYIFQFCLLQDVISLGLLYICLAKSFTSCGKDNCFSVWADCSKKIVQLGVIILDPTIVTITFEIVGASYEWHCVAHQNFENYTCVVLESIINEGILYVASSPLVASSLYIIWFTWVSYIDNGKNCRSFVRLLLVHSCWLAAVFVDVTFHDVGVLIWFSLWILNTHGLLNCGACLTGNLSQIIYTTSCQVQILVLNCPHFLSQRKGEFPCHGTKLNTGFAQALHIPWKRNYTAGELSLDPLMLKLCLPNLRTNNMTLCAILIDNQVLIISCPLWKHNQLFCMKLSIITIKLVASYWLVSSICNGPKEDLEMQLFQEYYATVLAKLTTYFAKGWGCPTDDTLIRLEAYVPIPAHLMLRFGNYEPIGFDIFHVPLHFCLLHWVTGQFNIMTLSPNLDLEDKVYFNGGSNVMVIRDLGQGHKGFGPRWEPNGKPKHNNSQLWQWRQYIIGENGYGRV